ncbi:MAG: hypothetical protein HOP00_07980 [Nitrospira sp.]|nr:hypothetical protein [Nitrospira sp.]
MNTNITPVNEQRADILELENRIRDFTISGEVSSTPNCPLTHHFAPGAYGREIHIPAGMLVVGKIHKHAHVNILSQGHVLVYTEYGPESFQAPRTWVSEPGTKRVVYAVSDVVWTTIHVTSETNLEVIEDIVIAKSYEEYEAFRQLTYEAKQCLG